MVVERVDPDRERQLALELGAAAGEHEVPAARRARSAQLGQQPRLADPRLAPHDDAARAAAPERVEGRLEPLELARPADEVRGLPDPRPARAYPA